jgi:hypothetical protein
MTTTALAAITAAETAAKYLFGDPIFTEIYLFGAVARGEDADIIDLIVAGPDDTYWNRFARELNRYDLAGDVRSIWQRHRAGVILLDLEYPRQLEDRVYQAVYTSTDPSPRIGLPSLNLLPFPADWRDRSDELQKALRCKNPDFMNEVARDARPWDSASGTFDDPPGATL